MNHPTLFDVGDPDEPTEPSARPTQQLLLVYAASRFSAACKSCGRPMTMVQLVGSRKWMPFDADPVAIKTSQDPDTHKLIEHLDAADVHFRTCPQADTHRRTR